MSEIASRYLVGRCAVILIPAATWSCGGTDVGAGPEVVRRDSAGIEIVENPRAPDAATWSVSDQATVDIGSASGPPEYLLSNVVTAARMTDGRIMIVEPDSRIKFFDSTGQLLREVQRRGDGPGLPTFCQV